MSEPTTLLMTLRDLLDSRIVLFAVASAVYWVGLSYSRGETRRLVHIPTVGPSAPLLSYFGAYRLVADARSVIYTGISKYPNSIFKVPHVLRWLVVITDPKVIDEVRKLPDSILSSFEAATESIQTEFTLGKPIRDNPYHLSIVRVQLTRAIPQLVPALYDEIVASFNDLIPATDNWMSVKILDTMMKVVARASNRVFVGLPLCRDPEYTALNVQFTLDVVKTSSILCLFPRPFRPFVNSLISDIPKRVAVALKHLAPVFAARRKEREEKGDDYPAKPVDLITWIMDLAKDKEEESDWDLTLRVLTINFAAIHTSSMTFTHAFFYLAAYPEYLKPLREEVENAVRKYGWTKEGLDQMQHIDSFIKESQRLNPLSIVLVPRVVLKDHVFSDGTMVPKGTTIATSCLPNPTAQVLFRKRADI
ncbi:unnamed protein product [Cyclocybe aegerita]|uniref:Cytochrome P450 n=1 Tax=Cyclocybe aegerita TaxID=1973307 RepID=A0A8S0XT14_CYCAE|nr:unnamed protein product [Cyclocybe aegerita]